MPALVSLILNTDGGSRGNPGPAAIGAVVYDASGTEIQRLQQTIGVATNNQAEYQALVMGLDWIAGHYPQALVIARLDSELVVRQLRREYRLKNKELEPWFLRVNERVGQLGDVVFEHVMREENQLADQLVNQALDEHKKEAE